MGRGGQGSSSWSLQVTRRNPDVSRQTIGDSSTLDGTLRIIPGADHIYLVLTPDQTLSTLCVDLTATWFSQKL